MPGQFGLLKGGGPGSIWKIDGRTGDVSLFADVGIGGLPNSAAGLGNLAFVPRSRQIYASDLETGMIHRFDLNGASLGYFDHGVDGRKAAGLTPTPFDAGRRVTLSSPAFDTQNPETWGFAPKERRVWDLAVRGARLFYSVADGPEVWSVGLNPDGSIAGDARREIALVDVPDEQISDMAFDGRGIMYVATRGAVRASSDFSAFTASGSGHVLRYAETDQAAPPAAPRWSLVGAEPETPEGSTGDGGVALGYALGEGKLRPESCGAAVWTIGEFSSSERADGAHVAGLRIRPAIEGGGSASIPNLVDFSTTRSSVNPTRARSAASASGVHPWR